MDNQSWVQKYLTIGSDKGEWWQVWCPLHKGDPGKTNASVKMPDGIFHCFECTKKGEDLPLFKLAEKMGVEKPDNPNWKKHSKSEPDHVYHYYKADGTLHFKICRKDATGKEEKAIWRDPTGVKGPNPLFKLAELLKDTRPVLLLEGEKKVELAQAALPDFFVTCWPGGAQNDKQGDFSPLAGRTVTLWPDNDQGGIDAMTRIAAKLKGLGCTVYMTRRTFNPEKKETWDIADALAECGESVDSVLQIIKNAVQPDDIQAEAPKEEQPEEKAPESYPLKTWDDFDNEPPAEWIIQDLIFDKTLYMITSAAGRGKSLFMLYVTYAVASGVSMFGKYDVKRRGPVLIVEEENSGTDHKLRREGLRHTGCKLEGLPVHFTHYQGVKINETESFLKLVETIKQIKPCLIIFDSLRRCHSGEENDSDSMRLVGERFREIVTAFECTVVLIHHMNRGGTSRGSTDIPAAIDQELALNPMDENLQLESTDKARRGPIKPLLLQIRGEPSEHDPSISVPIMYFIGEGQKRKNTKEDLKAAVIKALGLTALTKADLEMALENMGFQAVKRQLNDLLPRMAKEHRVKTQKIEGHGNKKFWSVL